MKYSLKKFIKKTSRGQRIILAAVAMVMVFAVASVPYLVTKAARNSDGIVFTTDDGLWNYVWDMENEYKITIVGYNGTDTDIVFPNKVYVHCFNGTYYYDTPVKFVAIDTTYSNFFTNIDASQVTSVTIPDNITEIRNAFRECTSLTTVNLPSTLKIIGQNTFYRCESLTSINLPDSLTTIGTSAFQRTSLTSISIPNSVTSLGYSCFDQCAALKQVNLSSKIKTIQSGAFSGCSSLQNIIIPYGCNKIEWAAFSGCKSLMNVVIPQSVKEIYSGAFSECSALEKIVIPDSVTTLEGTVFSGCTSLKSATLPKNIKEIPYNLFYGCSSLTEVKNISNITKINSYAFYDCSSLTTLELPDSLTEICDYAFANSAIDGSSLNLKNVKTLQVCALANMTFSGSFTIPPKVTYLPYRVFEGSEIPKLIFPMTVSSFDGEVFEDAKIIELVWDTTRSIDYRLFYSYNWSNPNYYPKKLTITRDIEEIGGEAFCRSLGLEEVNAQNIGTIGQQAFCLSAIKTFNAKNIGTIEERAFEASNELTTFNAKCTGEIGYAAFQDCTLLTDISGLIENTNTIYSYAFCRCSSLGGVTLGAQIISIWPYAFQNSGITILDAGNVSCTHIGEYAFDGCDKLTEVRDYNATLSDSVFSNCTSLQKFTFEGWCSSFGYCSSFFSGCSSLTDIYVLYQGDDTTKVNTSFLKNTPGMQTIHYYKPASGTDRWADYYAAYGESQTFQLDAMEIARRIKTITIDKPTPTTIEVGQTVHLSGTITYDDGTNEPATPENSIWRSGDTGYLYVDQNGNVTGLKSSSSDSCYIELRYKSNSWGASCHIDVVDPATPKENPASIISLESVVIEYNYILSRSFSGKPIVFDAGNNGIHLNKSGSSTESYIEVNVYPGRSTDKPTVEFTEGSDILNLSSMEFQWENWDATYSNYRAYFTHKKDDSGNYKYGDVTFKITAGNAQPITYSFTLIKDADRYPGNVCFDNASLEKKNIEVGNTYTYTAFPTDWYGAAAAGPYAWWQVTYEISDTSIADLNVELVKNAVTDPSDSSKQYDAYVATIKPKRAGVITLTAHPYGLSNYINYTNSFSIYISDPNNIGEEPKRPDDSGDPNVIWAKKVTFPSDTVTLAVGKTFTMNPLIEPANHTDDLTFYSYDKDIASVNAATGVITANSAGEVTVGVSTSSGLYAEMKVIVIDNEIHTKSITIPETFTLKEGEVKSLPFSRNPENATDDITWSSDNEGVVKVDGGNLTGVTVGSANITVTSGTISKTCKVTVTQPATGITLDKDSAEMKCGEKLQLNATLQPAGVEDDITWTSSNKKIATVSETGEVTAVGYGNVEITAMVNAYHATCNIFVSPTIDFTILGASIRMSDPYGIRFGVQLGKTGDFGKVKIVEYGTVMIPTDKLGEQELTLALPNVLKIEGKVIYSEDSQSRVYTGVLIGIPKDSFSSNISGRGYLIWEDTNGVQHTIYTNVVSRSLTGVAQAAYDSYSQITNPTSAQLEILEKLKQILGI